MANPFQRYQSGGFEPVPGIAQAGANIGSMLGSGFSNMAGSIAQGLQRYYETKAQSDAAARDAEITGSQLLMQQDAFFKASGLSKEKIDQFMSFDPEARGPDMDGNQVMTPDEYASLANNPYLRYAKTLQPALDKLAGIDKMGLNARLQTLNAAKASMGMVDQQMKNDAMIAQARLEDIQPPDTVQTEQEIKTADIAFDPNHPIFKGLKEWETAMKAKFPGNPEKIAEARKKYLDRVKSEISGPNSTATPEQQASLLEGIRRFETGEVDVSGVETYDGMMERMIREGDAATAEAAKPKPVTTGADVESKRKQLTDRIDALSKSKTKVRRITDSEFNKLAKETGKPSRYTQVMELEKQGWKKKTIDGDVFWEKQSLDAGVEREIEGLTKELNSLPKRSFVDEAKARIPELDVKIAELQKKIDSGDALVPTTKDEMKELGWSVAENINSWGGRRFAKALAARIPKDVTLTPEIADMLVKQVHEELGTGSLGMAAAITDFAESVIPQLMITGTGARRLTINETKTLEDALTAYQAKSRNQRKIERAPTEQIELEALKAERQRLANVAATGKKAPTPEQVKKSEPQKAAPSKVMNLGSFDLGTEMVERTLSSQEKETAAREFYKNRFGHVPVGFTQMYRQMYPEAQTRMVEVDTPAGRMQFIQDSKGGLTPLSKFMGGEQDVEKIASAKALTFNNTEIADGVVLTGIFGGTVAGAQAFRKDYAHMANVRSAIDELLQINNMGYESLSPTARARADQLQSEIIAALRIPIVGPGQVAIPEQEILQRIVRNPTAIFSLESQDLAALNGLKARVDRELVNWPKSMGLEVKISGNKSQTIKAIRMARQKAARGLGETE